MAADAGRPAAVSGLNLADPRGPGISRERGIAGFSYFSPTGAEVTDALTLDRIRALAIPPAWEKVRISPDPLGHIQATGVDSRGRTQYLYHQRWRQQRDAQKFAHMLRFAQALPALRAATIRDLGHLGLDRDRVIAAAVRLIDIGLFRIGGERYAELDHHYGATTLEKRHVSFTPGAVRFDYVAKEGKRRTITITDPAVQPTIRALAATGKEADALFTWYQGGAWHRLHSHDVSSYIAARSAGHFTAKEFRTWNASVLMALLLANAGPVTTARGRMSAVTAGVRVVADWLGDTPSVARRSYIDPRLIARFLADGNLPGIPGVPAELPPGHEAEIAVAALLAAAAAEEEHA